MKQYANELKWADFYLQLNNQAKDNEKIIFASIPKNVSEDEIERVIQELHYLYNFKDYKISRNNNRIKGVRYV